VKKNLVATGKDPDARGRARLVVRGSNGRLGLSARRLEHGAAFEVIVDGVRIGTLTTGPAGNGKARFSTRPRGQEQLLGVDPRGRLLEVRDDDGDDVLETEMPDDSEPGEIRCCVADDEETECEAETPAECDAQGGVNLGEGSCVPNPCAPPSPHDEIRCCIPDDGEDGPECEESTAAECSAEGGVNIGPGACEEHACAPTPPGDEEIRCCVAENDAEGDEHEDDGEDGDDEHEGEAPECERVTAAACSALGGTSLGPGSCEPNPCVASPSGAFLEAAALP
jgi:hypothetical protein